MSSDLEFAYETVRRLNRLIASDPGVLPLLNDMVETRVPVHEDLADHPTIQVRGPADDEEGVFEVGFLGLLNGIIGVQPEGVEREQYGYIWMVDDEKFSVVHNKVTVDELLENPKEGVMYLVSGEVVDGPYTLSGTSFDIKGQSGEVLMVVFDGDLTPTFPKTGEQVEVYGILERVIDDYIFTVKEKFPGLSWKTG